MTSHFFAPHFRVFHTSHTSMLLQSLEKEKVSQVRQYGKLINAKFLAMEKWRLSKYFLLAFLLVFGVRNTRHYFLNTSRVYRRSTIDLSAHLLQISRRSTLDLHVDLSEVCGRSTPSIHREPEIFAGSQDYPSKSNKLLTIFRTTDEIR